MIEDEIKFRNLSKRMTTFNNFNLTANNIDVNQIN